MLSSTSIATPTPRFAKVREWTKLIAITGSAQIVVQAIGFVSGILVIRLLPIQEYAFYTLANTMLGTMTLLADAGVATAVMSIGGRVWQDRLKLGSVLSTGFAVRRRFAVISLIISTPVVLYLMQKHGATLHLSILLMLSLAPAFFAAISGSLLEIVPKLHQDIAALQKIQLAAATLRLLLTVLSLFWLPFAAVATLASGISQLFANMKLRDVATKHVDLAQPENSENRTEIISVVKRVFPGAIYYSVASQIPIWLISIFGVTEGIAQVGALGRLATVLSIFSSVFGVLVVPRFARMKSLKNNVLTKFLQLQFMVFIVCVVLVLSVFTFPTQVLYVLGSNYKDLTNEVFLMSLTAALSFLVGGTYSLGAARGFIFPPHILYPMLILVQLGMLSTMNLKSVEAVLVYSVMIQSITFLVYFLFICRKCYSNHD